jgi:RNA 3'-phosphate cyclase
VKAHLIDVDGSMMEGGGQLLRMATTYSAVLGKPVRVHDIRSRRSPPGLKQQHLVTLRAAGDLCNASVKGDRVGSKAVEFTPGTIKGGEYSVDIGTAGSISLLLQCLTPIAMFADSPVSLRVKGGTAVAWSPTIPFIDNVVWRCYRSMGVKCELKLSRHGFYPKGGGEVIARFKPIKDLQGFQVEEQTVSKILGVSICGKLPSHVAERQASSAKSIVRDSGLRAEVDVVSLEGDEAPLSPGSLICLWTDSMYLGADSLGKRGKPAEKVGSEAAVSLIDQLGTGAQVDYHTADHLILPISLSRYDSRFVTSRVSLHTLTAIELAKAFTDAVFEVKGKDGEPGTITCSRAGS